VLRRNVALLPTGFEDHSLVPLTRYEARFRGVPAGQGPPEAVGCDGGVRGRRRWEGSPRTAALEAPVRRDTIGPTGEGLG